ncbi:MAG: hypothetical protein JWO86_386 [Myxococcaceae bacterium]|jgi:hypothetical protein|nr:hypothetical protein [Myxococcaceae bacterium]MEA2752180.1 hypothetical protein [Myxococcales bacterium]
MKVKQLVSMAAWGALVVFMLPLAASTASAHEQEPEATPLEGSQCWGRCSACTTRCAAVHGSDRERCERICQAGNDRCCEASGRNGSSRACGCY